MAGKVPTLEKCFLPQMKINGQSCHYKFKELKKIKNSKQRYRRSGKVRHSDRRKMEHQQVEPREIVEEKTKVITGLKATCTNC